MSVHTITRKQALDIHDRCVALDMRRDLPRLHSQYVSGMGDVSFLGIPWVPGSALYVYSPETDCYIHIRGPRIEVAQ